MNRLALTTTSAGNVTVREFRRSCPRSPSISCHWGTKDHLKKLKCGLTEREKRIRTFDGRLGLAVSLESRRADQRRVYGMLCRSLSQTIESEGLAFLLLTSSSLAPH